MDPYEIVDEFLGTFRRVQKDHPKWVDPRSQLERRDNPYSYSEFFHFGNRDIIKTPGLQADYSDRLWQWDYAKAQSASAEHLGCRFELATVAQLDAFVTAYWGKQRHVVALAEGCNPATGYPYYIIWHRQAS